MICSSTWAEVVETCSSTQVVAVVETCKHKVEVVVICSSTLVVEVVTCSNT